MDDWAWDQLRLWLEARVSDLSAARERGIAVFNAPYSNTRSVAELVLAEAILLLRGIPEKNASCHRGGWIKSAANSFEIRGKKLGIVGYGSIGTQLSVLAEGLGMQVYFYDTVTKLPLGNATQVGTICDGSARAGSPIQIQTRPSRSITGKLLTPSFGGITS